MILEKYLYENNSNLRLLHQISGIPESTVRSLNKRSIEKWSIEYFDAISKCVGKDRFTVIKELEDLEYLSYLEKPVLQGKYDLENRRYIGNKSKLLNWISELVDKHTEGESFFDVFAGTGVVTKNMLKKYHKFIINDFLHSNQMIYEAFFGDQAIDVQKINNFKKVFQQIKTNCKDDEYFVSNYGGKFFSENDARIIGEIRTCIENSNDLNSRERSVLIASLLYSADKIANTVGHYDAYRKKVEIKDRFKYDLINPLDTSGKEILIYRNDSNELANYVESDIAFVDPPYNSRQYSRFYHVLEGIAKWDKPRLEGVAMKPPAENMSDYSKTSAPDVFDNLIQNLKSRYIVVTYNNTYNSRSNSSKNKISHEQILFSLNKVGRTKIFEMPYQFFNAGKTDLSDHKEFLFITEVKNNG